MVFLGVNLVLCVAIQVICASKSIIQSRIPMETKDKPTETGQMFVVNSESIRLENKQPLIKRVIEKQKNPSRRMVEVARVEMRPGVRKTRIITYPPKFLQARLNRLLKLKAKRVAKGK